MAANLITLFRVALAFLSVGLFGHGTCANLAAVGLLSVSIGLDAVDGWVARRFKCDSSIGAAFDIAGDRIVENIFWIYFTKAGLISFWIPMIIIARGCMTDFLRAAAFAQGQTAFGEGGMMQTWWGRLLVGSRASRAAYGIVKFTAFLLLGFWYTITSAPGLPIDALANAILAATVPAAALILAIAAVSLCLIRGVPVLIEGMRFFRKGAALPRIW